MNSDKNQEDFVLAVVMGFILVVCAGAIWVLSTLGGKS